MESLYNVGMKILTASAIAVVLFAPIDLADPTLYPVPIEPVAEVIIDPEEHLCLQKNIYFEARNQGREGMKGVAAVTLNRVNDPRFPDTICEVVYQRKQFSWANRGDREPRLTVKAEVRAWEMAGEVAERAMLGIMEHSVGQAQYFHTTSVRPGWRGMEPVITIRDHIFLYQPM